MRKDYKLAVTQLLPDTDYPSDNYFQIQGIYPNTEFKLYGAFGGGIIEISYDKTNWISYEGEKLVLDYRHPCVYVRGGKENSTNLFDTDDIRPCRGTSYINDCNAPIKISGRIRSLFEINCAQNQYFVYDHLFSSPCSQYITVIDEAKYLILDSIGIPDTSQFWGNPDYGQYTGFLEGQPILEAPDLSNIKISHYCCKAMFEDTNLITMPNMPQITYLGKSCFANMFANTNIASTKTLNISTITPIANYYGSNAFEYMFAWCKNLTSISNLFPANVVINNGASSTFYNMFRQCRNLTNICNIPLSNDEYAYNSMFYECTSLEELPSSLGVVNGHLYYYQFASMFAGCSKIKVSETQTGEYQNTIIINGNPQGATTWRNVTNGMFGRTGGTFGGTPQLNTTYYTSNITK